MTENISYIPSRVRNAAKGGHVAGAVDIIDDVIGMTQERINNMVIDGAISVGFSSSTVVTVNQATNITMTATSKHDTDITIKKNGGMVAEGSNRKSLQYVDTGAVINIGDSVSYSAHFAFGNKSKDITLKPVFYGVSTTGSVDAETLSGVVQKALLKSSAAGSYSINVTVADSYVWFVMPNGYSVSKATLSGFEFLLQAVQRITVNGVEYNVYRSENPNRVESFDVVLS